MLSKIIIFVTRNNLLLIHLVGFFVVNCFQKLLSSWHETTKSMKSIIHLALWIAFKNYYLRDTKQLSFYFYVKGFRCELLSKIIIFVTRNNKVSRKAVFAYVVNCFQKLLSSWHETTSIAVKRSNNPLWIAFKNYYLRDTKQHQLSRLGMCVSCELLSKIIIFVTRNNMMILLN